MIQAVSCSHTNIWSRRHHTECLDTDFHCRRAHAIITQSLNLINGFKFEFPHSEESEKGKVVATSPNDNLALAPARMDMHARGDLYKVSLSLPVPCILKACQFALITLSLSPSLQKLSLCLRSINSSVISCLLLSFPTTVKFQKEKADCMLQ